MILTSSNHHEEQRSSQVGEEAHNPRLNQVEETASSMEKGNDGVHAIAGEQICTSEDGHDQTNREDHRTDGTDQPRRVGLEPRCRFGGKCESTTDRDHGSTHEAVDEHLVKPHSRLLGSDAGDELRGLSWSESIHDGHQYPMELSSDCRGKGREKTAEFVTNNLED